MYLNSQVNDYKYYIGAGVVFGGYKLYTYLKKNQNPDAKKFENNVNKLEKILAQNSSVILLQKTDIISLFAQTDTLNKKAKEKSMKFHSKYETYNVRYIKAIDIFNSLIYYQIDAYYKDQIDLFNISIQTNELNKANGHIDTLALIYNSVSWNHEDSLIKNIKETHTKFLDTHNSISKYLFLVNELLKIENNSKIDDIINLLNQKISEQDKVARNINIIELYGNKDEMIFALIKINFNHYINTLEIPNTKNEEAV